MKQLILRVIGGLGRNIVGTVIARQIKAQNPGCTLHVVASYPDVFVGLPFVDRVYPFTQSPMPDFFDNHRDFDVLEAEPYVDLQYRRGNQHLADVWCRRLGLNLPESKRGSIELHGGSEVEWAKRTIASMNLGRTPLLAFQPFGGTSFMDAGAAQDVMRPQQERSLKAERANEIVNKLATAGIAVVQISLPTEPQLQQTLKIQLPQGQVMQPRLLFSMLQQCHGFLGIDSFGQHAWAALGKDNAVVLWGATNPTNLGYAGNTNMTRKNACQTPHCNRPDTHMGDVLGNGQPWRCPNPTCMNYDVDEVVQAVRATMQPKEQQAQAADAPKPQ